jgi:hypothetical protein
MSNIKGDLQIFGWEAESFKNDDTYLVTYSYAHVMGDGIIHGWAFEVNLSAGAIRYIIGDPELEKKYGWDRLKQHE